MQVVTYKIIPEPDKNSVTYSKNYRIFSTGEPLLGAVKIVGFDESIELGSSSSSYINRKFRYSTNRGNWSLWYSFIPTDISEIEALDFANKDIFFEVKYEYDNGVNYDALVDPLVINNVKFRVQSTHVDTSLYTPTVYCSAERCPALIAEREASFKPYEVGSAIGISKELSLQTNKLFGHEVVYFKTEPDREGGDFIFKEWTLFKTIDRKCVKVVVPNNVFPDNKPNFTEFGVDFEIPFEIHIDNIYFQSIFGPSTQPRKRDYLYFPLTNRMYEIQGSYLFRGFMMEPLYWKIQLTKFHPNMDMLMKETDRRFLDNIIMTSDELFGAQAEVQTKDALDKQQFKTISTKFDETRRSLHADLDNKILDKTFNYAPLIEYYYDMSSVKSIPTAYLPTSANTKEDQVLRTTAKPYEIWAYEGSEIYSSWINHQLNTGDSYIDSTGKLIPVKMNGPKDSFVDHLGKYVVVEGYRDLSLTTRFQNLSIPTTGPYSGKFWFNQSEHAVVYKAVASTDITPNMTFSALIKLNRGLVNFKIFEGYDNINNSGLRISCGITDSAGIPTVSIHVLINTTTYSFTVGELLYDEWYSLIIPVSAQYGQLAVNVYEFNQDPANIKNYNRLDLVFNQSSNTGTFSFVTTQNWALPAANYSIANVRLFNTMVQAEDHEFIVSQLFVRDESLLEIIDNSRPRLNVPFIAINK